MTGPQEHPAFYAGRLGWCPACGSGWLDEAETGPMDPQGNTDMYLVCEDCGHEVRYLGRGRGVL